MARQRFVGRPGNPSKVSSDNGSNFVDANKELMRLDKRALQDRLSPSGTQCMRLDKRALQDRLSPSGTQWHRQSPRKSLETACMVGAKNIDGVM
ncbi:unnamed protein product [Echinostoma caproni]|uniref:Integrase catalytic domain-containing protein n=1 Tax=Echinostoma caproni TaxID=27848 RepID=A0A183BGK5_9TREM|nr:unnamed protein product [Echinostoma caproni]